MDVIIENEQEIFKEVKEIEKLIETAACKTLEAESLSTDIELSVLLVDNEAIQELNKIHRGKDNATDVLSFPQYNSKEEIASLKHPVLGDIVISLEKASEQALEYGHSLEREIGFLTVHSMLHLLGYDHDTESNTTTMRKHEEIILKEMGLVRENYAGS